MASASPKRAADAASVAWAIDTRGVMQIRLDNGTVIRLADAEAHLVYGDLWRLVPLRGAIAAAGKLQHALRQPTSLQAVTLDAYESAAFTTARPESSPPAA